MNEFGGALADHLTAQHPRRAALADEHQKSRGLSRNVGARDLAEVGSADDHVDFLRRGFALG